MNYKITISTSTHSRRARREGDWPSTVLVLVDGGGESWVSNYATTSIRYCERPLSRSKRFQETDREVTRREIISLHQPVSSRVNVSVGRIELEKIRGCSHVEDLRALCIVVGDVKCYEYPAVVYIEASIWVHELHLIISFSFV